jgi:RHS repeat-associated protein
MTLFDSNKLIAWVCGLSQYQVASTTRKLFVLAVMQRFISTLIAKSKAIFLTVLIVLVCFNNATAQPRVYYVTPGILEAVNKGLIQEFYIQYYLFESADAACQNYCNAIKTASRDCVQAVIVEGTERSCKTTINDYWLDDNGLRGNFRRQRISINEVGLYSQGGYPAPLVPPKPDIESTGSSCTAAGSATPYPIAPATGEKQLYETDWSDSSSHPLSIIRSYRSQVTTSFAGLTNLATHWHLSVIASFSLSADQLEANLSLGSGNARRFSRDSLSAVWKSNSTFNEQLLPITLPSGAAGWRYQSGTGDDSYLFNTNGQLIRHTQRNGWTMNYAYNANNQLTTITNHFGRSLALAYNASGLLSSITTPDAQVISYQYDSSSRLIRASYSNNTARQYLYENPAFPHLLTGVIDENNTRLSTYSYDAQGRAIETTKASGADRYQVSYGASAGNAITSATITDPLGTPRTYNYATRLSQLAVTGADKPSGQGQRDAASRIQSALGLIEQETDFLGFTTQYVWDTTRRLKTQETIAAGRPEQQTVQTQWHPTFRLPAQVTEQGKTTAYTYDAVGNLLTQQETDTTGSSSNGQTRTWSYTYNTAGLMTAMRDARGQAWAYTYDAQGNRTSNTNPAGHASSYTYDGAGRMLTETAPNGLVTSYQYDLRGRVTQITRGSNLAAAQRQTTAYTYSPSGQIATASLPNGHQLSYTYDAAQRLTGASDNRGNAITYTLDAMGNRVSETIKDASQQIALSTQRVINSLNRLEAIQGGTNPAQQTTAFQYDANGNPVRSTDPLGAATQTTLDALRRPITTQLPDGNQADSYYNQLNQLTAAIDPKGVQTSYVRNAWGEVLSESSPDIGQTSYTRDAVGNVLTMQDAKSQITSYQYDALSRVTQITFADGKQQTFLYDGTAAGNQIGSLREMQDTSGNTRYERDPFGRIMKKTQTVNDNPTNPTVLTTSYAYTNAGDLAQITYPSGLNVFYRRNPSGQITAIDTQKPRTSALRAPAIASMVSNIQYTALNQPKSWAWNCITGNLYTPTIQSNCDAAARTFDQDGRITSTEFSSYTYDPASRITQITQNLWAERTTTVTVGTQSSIVTELYQVPFTWAAGYDTRARLTSFNRPGSEQSYSYDANSNRLTSIAKKISDTDIDGIFEATDRAATTSQSLSIESTSNKLLGFNQSVLTQATAANGTRRTLSNVITAINYQLDANGNLISDGLRSFDYNAENRLEKVQITQNGEAAKISYLHNAQGQRVFNSEPQTAQTLPNAAELGTTFVDWLKKNFQWLYATAQTNATLGTSYSYGEGQLPAWAMTGEYGNGGASSTGRTEYIWLPTDDGAAIPIAIFRGNRYSSIHSDHLGTPRLMKDDTAKPVWQWSYSAFGDNKPTGILKATTNPNSAITNQPVLLNATNPGAVLNLRFPGQYADSETGLFYNYFRTFQPNQGRYTQADPIGLAGGWSRFGYSYQDGINNYDPTGLCVGPLLILCANPTVAGLLGGAASLGYAVVNGVGGPATSAVSAVKSSRVVEQYALRANESGFYPVMNRGFKDATSLQWCDKGDVWKFGTTVNPLTRYSQNYLDNIGEYGVSYSREFGGTLSEALILESMKIRNYLQQTGQLPAGNKIIK